MKTWKAALGVVLIFVLGMAAGGLVTGKIFQRKMQRVVLGGPPAVGELITRRLSWQLRLDKAQRVAVREAMTDAQRNLQVLRARARPEAREILIATETRIRSVLRPDQAEKFDRLVAERQTRWRRGPGGRAAQP